MARFFDRDDAYDELYRVPYFTTSAVSTWDSPLQTESTTTYATTLTGDDLRKLWASTSSTSRWRDTTFIPYYTISDACLRIDCVHYLFRKQTGRVTPCTNCKHNHNGETQVLDNYCKGHVVIYGSDSTDIPEDYGGCNA